MYQTVLKGARILDGDSSAVYDIVIGDSGVIQAIAPGLAGREEIGLDGNNVLPGLVDVHVHFRGGPHQKHKETFYSGSRAALSGGITYVGDMPNNDPSIITPEKFRKKRSVAQRDSTVNFGLYVAVTQESLQYLQELAPLVLAFKLFMGESTGKINYPYERIAEAFEAVAGTGKVLCVHAEDQRRLDKGKRDYGNGYGYVIHALSRPQEAEIEAIKYALKLADEYKVPLHISHVTTKEGVEAIERAKQSGVDITSETCPHYLFLKILDLMELGPYAKMNPPLRRGWDNDALWKGLQDGTIDWIASDHAPHTRKEKDKGLNNIWLAPSGVPGVETTLPLILNAVNEEKLTLPQLIGLMHDNPVERFGLGRYGYIEEGNLANMTVVDLNKSWEIRDEKLKTKCGWSPFDGWTGVGRPVGVVINGIYHKI